MRPSKSILVIHPDTATRYKIEQIARGMRGLRAQTATSGRSAAAALTSRRFCVVVVSANLPDMSVGEVTRLARLRDPACRFIVMRGGEDQIVQTATGSQRIVDMSDTPLDEGGLRAALEETTRVDVAAPCAAKAAVDVVFDLERRAIVLKAGKRITLTPREALLIDYLRSAKGAPVPRRELLREVWGYAEMAETHTLETHVYRIRKKIDIDDAPFKLVTSESGGYRLLS